MNNTIATIANKPHISAKGPRDTAVYLVTIGNTEPRKGHRHDCAQVAVTVYVRASSVDDAVAVLNATIETNDGRIVSNERARAGACRGVCWFDLRANTEHIAVRTVGID